jgi:hypothetical protein
MYTVDRDEYAEKLILYTSVRVCGCIQVKIDRNSSTSKKVEISRILYKTHSVVGKQHKKIKINMKSDM